MKRLRRLVLGTLAVLALAMLGVAPARANATCHGKFVNPITDVCWSCLFPLSIGGLSIWNGSRPDPKNPTFPLCACGSPIPRIGIAVGFWEPVRLVDVTNKAWCFPNLGGIGLNPGFDIGNGHVQGRSQVGKGFSAIDRYQPASGTFDEHDVMRGSEGATAVASQARHRNRAPFTIRRDMRSYRLTQQYRIDLLVGKPDR